MCPPYISADALRQIADPAQPDKDKTGTEGDAQPSNTGRGLRPQTADELRDRIAGGF